MPETRRIENYGILKLLPEERGANKLIVFSDVIQLPYSEYMNTKTNPYKSHYGYVNFMYDEYVIYTLDIQFRRQLILDREGFLVQLAWQEFCNARKILSAVGATPAPDTPVEYPIWQCDELRFKLEPGVILNVWKTHIPMTICSGDGISQPGYTGTPPDLPSNPSPPPPKNTPPDQLIPLSPPYEGTDDNGNTYLRPQALPTLPDQPIYYTVTGSAFAAAPGTGTELNATFSGTLQGPLTVQENTNNHNPYGSCDSAVNILGPNGSALNALSIERHTCGSYTYSLSYTPAT